MGYYKDYLYEDAITWTTDGANAGTVFYRNGKFSITNVCGLLEICSSDLLAKFLYYVLIVEAPKYVNDGMGNPKLMSNVMSNIKIPVPPLPVQREIVRILDNFTELTAELTARKKERHSPLLLCCRLLFDCVYKHISDGVGDVAPLYLNVCPGAARCVAPNYHPVAGVQVKDLCAGGAGRGVDPRLVVG